MDTELQQPKAPIHFFSAGLIIILDWLWTPAESGFTLSGVGIIALPLIIILLGVIAFTGVFLVQKFMANDTIGGSVAKAFVLAVAAAIPFPVTGTVVGTGLLGISGLNAIKRATGNI